MSGAADLQQIVTGLTRMARTRPDMALRQARSLLDQFPRLVPLECLAANLARHAGALEVAERHLEAALAEDPEAPPALAEIRRVLKPGGQVGLGFWIEQSDIEWLVAAFSRYLAQAAAADRAIRQGRIGKLTGIPLAIKDLICTRGQTTTCGSSSTIASIVRPISSSSAKAR